jgi:hypothetical protein
MMLSESGLAYSYGVKLDVLDGSVVNDIANWDDLTEP